MFWKHVAAHTLLTAFPGCLRCACSAPPLQGEWLRSYQSMAERPHTQPPGADELGPVPPSNAYVRRVKGTHW